MNTDIKQKQSELTQHPVYQTFTTIDSIRHFMGYHVFAVWDFMSLLKALQIRLTSVSVPWKPSVYPTEIVRLINQIVVGEESDIDPAGNAISHFDLYLRGMEEIGADTAPIKNFLKADDLGLIPDGARQFVEANLQLAKQGHVVEVAASFFFGREKLIPDMFQSIVNTLKKENISAPTFLYYLERHIEVDSGEHGPLALKALSHLIDGRSDLEALATTAGLNALKAREILWDKVLETLPEDLRTSQIPDLSTYQSLY
jgi:hypothetical protein